METPILHRYKEHLTPIAEGTPRSRRNSDSVSSKASPVPFMPFSLNSSAYHKNGIPSYSGVQLFATSPYASSPSISPNVTPRPFLSLGSSSNGTPATVPPPSELSPRFEVVTLNHSNSNRSNSNGVVFANKGKPMRILLNSPSPQPSPLPSYSVLSGSFGIPPTNDPPSPVLELPRQDLSEKEVVPSFPSFENKNVAWEKRRVVRSEDKTRRKHVRRLWDPHMEGSNRSKDDTHVGKGLIIPKEGKRRCRSGSVPLPADNPHNPRYRDSNNCKQCRLPELVSIQKTRRTKRREPKSDDSYDRETNKHRRRRKAGTSSHRSLSPQGKPKTKIQLKLILPNKNNLVLKTYKRLPILPKDMGKCDSTPAKATETETETSVSLIDALPMQGRAPPLPSTNSELRDRMFRQIKTKLENNLVSQKKQLSASPLQTFTQSHPRAFRKTRSSESVLVKGRLAKLDLSDTASCESIERKEFLEETDKLDKASIASSYSLSTTPSSSSLSLTPIKCPQNQNRPDKT